MKVSNEVSEASLDNSDKLAQQKVRFQNVFDTVKDGIGQVVASLYPMMEALGSILGTVAKIAGFAAGGIGQAAGGVDYLTGGPGSGKAFLAKAGMTEDMRDIKARIARGGMSRSQALGIDSSYDERGEIYVSDAEEIYVRNGGSRAEFRAQHEMNRVRDEGTRALLGGFKDAGLSLLGGARDVTRSLGGVQFDKDKKARARDWTGDGYHGASESAFDPSKFGSKSLDEKLDDTIKWWGDFTKQMDERSQDSLANNMERFALANAELQEIGRAAQAERRTSMVETVFGSIDQISMTDAGLQALGGTWDSVTGSVMAGFGAMIDGSASFGAAFKQALGAGLKAQAMELGVLALKETGLGIASLALGPLGGVSAGAHFKAAAVFAGAATLAGFSSHALGGGASAAAASGARSYASGGGSGAANNNEPTRIIVYADAFAHDSERGKRAQAEKIVSRAYGSTAVENS
jgi:hypothetical protein